MRWLASVLLSFAHSVRTSLRYRLVLLTALTIVVGAAISGVGTYQAARISLYNQLDLELLSIAESMAGSISVDLEGNPDISSTTSDAENVVVVLVWANTNITILLGDTTAPPDIGDNEIAVARIQIGSSARDGESSDGTKYRIVSVPFLDSTGQYAYALVISRDLTPTSTSLANLATLQWIIGLVAIVLCLIVAILVADTTLNPIQQLTSVVSGITSADELATIEVRGPSEVAELERSFNMMMGSLAESRQQQNRLIADAGHELRTPLTSLRTNIELLIADENAEMLPKGASSQILSDVAAQLGEFTSLINDLVALSRGDVAPNFITTDFSDVVSRAITRAQRRGPSMIFDVSLEPVYVMGDSVTLERAVTNLLDNAVKFSPQGGTITVRLHSGTLTISDEGPGISDEDIPHVFERFYRSDSSRNTPGTGLGLSIVDHTVTAHGGTVEVSRAPSGGALFTVHLPTIEPVEE